MAVGDDALGAGGIVDVSTDLLTAFAGQNLESYLDDTHNNPSIQSIAKFAAGAGSVGGGVSPSGDYDEVMPGNTKGGNLQSAVDLQTGFKTMAGTINDHVGNMHTMAQQFQSDLRYVSTTLVNADDAAKITAHEMPVDLISDTPGGGGTGGSGTGGSGTGGSGSGTGGSGTGGSSTS
jgi:hypothetical protein